MTTTSQLRLMWAPACTGPFTRVALYGKGVVSVRAKIVPAVNALSAVLKKYSYETRAADTGAYNCRPITGGTAYSLHAYGIAMDINWLSNPYGGTLITDMPKPMIDAIKAIRTKNGKQVWRWGGDYSGNKDAMHFEVVCSPADLATGIAVPAAPQPQPPAPEPEEEDIMIYYIWLKDDRPASAAVKPVAGVHLYAVVGKTAVHQTTDSFNIDSYLAAVGHKPLTIVGSTTKPYGFAWASGLWLVDGPLKGI